MAFEINNASKIWDDVRDLVPLRQVEKCEKHTWSITFSNVASVQVYWNADSTMCIFDVSQIVQIVPNDAKYQTYLQI